MDDDGTVFCRAWVDRGRGFKKAERFALNLYRIDAEEVASTRINNIDLDNVTTDIKDGVYIVFGTHSVKGFQFLGWGDPGGEVGFVTIKWNGGDKEKPEVRKFNFGAEHVAKNQPSKERKKWKSRESKGKSVHVPHFRIDHVIRLEDGSHVVLAQERFIVVTTSKSGMTRTKYYNLDIHAFGLDEDMDIQWSTIIPCYQLVSDPAISGYAYKLMDKKLYVIFNDNYRNLDKEWNTSKKPNRFSGGESPTTMVAINMDEPDTRQKREMLWKSGAVGGTFRSDLYYSPDDQRSALAYIQGGKLKQSLIRIDFK